MPYSKARTKSKAKPTKKTSPRRTPRSVKKQTKKRAASSSPSRKESAPVTIDRRSETTDRRDGDERRTQGKVVTVNRRKLERRKPVTRRRQIDPTTCERDYTLDEIEFMKALDDYKRKSGRMFPTCSEVLEVIKDLGYARPVPAVGEPALPETRTADNGVMSNGG